MSAMTDLATEQRKRQDWELACNAAKFAIRLRDEGRTEEDILSAIAEIFGLSAFEKRAPYQGEPGLEKQEDWS
jgi:hypothetical protein